MQQTGDRYGAQGARDPCARTHPLHGIVGTECMHWVIAGEVAMQQAVDSGASRKAGEAGDPSARVCSQSADVSSAGRTEGRPVRRVGSAPEASSRCRHLRFHSSIKHAFRSRIRQKVYRAESMINLLCGCVGEHRQTCRSRRLRRRGNRRISNLNSGSEGSKTGILSRVERSRVIQREYLVRKRVRIISIMMEKPVIDQLYYTFMSRSATPRPYARRSIAWPASTSARCQPCVAISTARLVLQTTSGACQAFD